MSENLLSQLQINQAMSSPAFGKGKVIQIYKDGFSVKYDIGQFIYNPDGTMYPHGKEQSVFILQE